MSFADAIQILNRLKSKHIIKDYAIIGAIASTAYMEPVFTQDLDIIILTDTDEEFLNVYRRIGEISEGHEGLHHILGGVPVQVFPSNTKPLYKDTLEKAHWARVSNSKVKVASNEHLIVLYLEAFREKE